MHIILYLFFPQYRLLDTCRKIVCPINLSLNLKEVASHFALFTYKLAWKSA